MIGSLVKKNQSEDYYDVLITIVTDLLNDTNTSKKEGN